MKSWIVDILIAGTLAGLIIGLSVHHNRAATVKQPKVDQVSVVATSVSNQTTLVPIEDTSYTIQGSPQTNFLTITNRTYIKLDFGAPCYVFLFHFTDEEWRLLTNYYREYYTGTMMFRFSGPITNAPK